MAGAALGVPDWLSHSQSFRRFLRRCGIGGTNLYDLFGGILPVSLVQRSWQDDELDLYGVSTLTISPANTIPAVVIIPPPDLDTYLRQIDVIAFAMPGPGAGSITGQSVGLFTPNDPYNPTDQNLTRFFPGFWASRGLISPQTIFLAGTNTAFQGPPFAPATYNLDFTTVGGNTYLANWNQYATAQLPPNPEFIIIGTLGIVAPTIFVPKSTRILSLNDPPIRLPANDNPALGSIMALQLQQKPAVQYALQCTFLFQEQNALQF